MMKRSITLAMALLLCLLLLPLSALAFNPDGYKATITKISIGAPITDTNTGKKYLPVDVHFTASENLSDQQAVAFLEGYLKATLSNGQTSQGIQGLGMTLMGPMKPDVDLFNNSWSWTWEQNTNTGTGVLKYNLPLLEDGETQSVEQSMATGQTEVNGLTVGDSVTFQTETVLTSQVGGQFVLSDPVTVTIENLNNYPKTHDFTSGQPGEPQPEPEYTVTVKYLMLRKADGIDRYYNEEMPSGCKRSDTKTAKAGARVTITPPSYPNMVCSDRQVVIQLMPAGNVEVYVFYWPSSDTGAISDIHRVTVTYTLPQGVSGIAGYVAQRSRSYREGQKYVIPTPALSGFVPSAVIVYGTMGQQDVSQSVTYQKTTCSHMGSQTFEKMDGDMHKIICSACHAEIGADHCDIYYTHNPNQHTRKCRKCERSEVGDHAFNYRQKDAFKHTNVCECGYEADVEHKLGKRFFYDWKRGYGQYIIYYAQKCSLCQQKLEGRVYYWDGHWFDMWNDREAFFKMLIENGYVDESWMNHPIQKYGIFGLTSLYKIYQAFCAVDAILYGQPYELEPTGLMTFMPGLRTADSMDVPNELKKLMGPESPNLSQRVDLHVAKVSADYGKLLGRSTDVDCVKEWKNAAGKINAAKAAGKPTPDSKGIAERGLPTVLAPKDGEPARHKANDPWAEGETLRMMNDDYVIDESKPLDDCEFDLTLSEEELEDASENSIGGASFAISQKALTALGVGSHTITLWIDGVDHDTGEPVAMAFNKEIQVVEFGGELMATDAMVYNGRYASLNVVGRTNGKLGVCDGAEHALNIALKTPDIKDQKGNVITPGVTLTEGEDYNLYYYRSNDGKTLRLTKEIRAAGEYLIVALPADDSPCYGMAYGVYTVAPPVPTTTDVVLPSGLKTIDPSAFEGSAAMKSVYVGDNCEKIDQKAFANCKALKLIRLPQYCDIDDTAFSGTSLAICGSTGLDVGLSADLDDIEDFPELAKGTLTEGTVEKWAADHNIPFIPIEAPAEPIPLD